MPIYKNVALPNVAFQSLTTSGAANTSTTPTVTVSKDGGAPASATNSPSHVGNGHWKISLTQTEMNADVVVVTATASGCVPAQREIYTEADYSSTRAGYLDAAVSSRSTYAGADTGGTTTLLARFTTQRASNLDYLDVSVQSIKSKTDLLPANPAAVGSQMQLDLTQAVSQVDVSLLTTMTVGHCLAAARAEAAGAESLVGTTWTKRNPDGSTFRAFTIDDSDAPTLRS